MNRTQLNAALNTAFADNTSGAITPAVLRTQLQSILDYVDTEGGSTLLDHSFANGAGPFTLAGNGGTAEIVNGKLRVAGNGSIAYAMADGNFTPSADNIRITVYGVTVVKGIVDVRVSNNSYATYALNLVTGNNVTPDINTTIGSAGVSGNWTAQHNKVYLQTTGTDDEATITRIKIEKV